MRIVQKHQATPAPEPPQKDDDEEEYVASRYEGSSCFLSSSKLKANKQESPLDTRDT